MDEITLEFTDSQKIWSLRKKNNSGMIFTIITIFF